jgi:hypothetical protein
MTGEAVIRTGLCRCRHGYGAHRRRSGKLRLPCQYVLARDVTGRYVQVCPCRDWHPGASK